MGRMSFFLSASPRRIRFFAFTVGSTSTILIISLAIAHHQSAKVLWQVEPGVGDFRVQIADTFLTRHVHPIFGQIEGISASKGVDNTSIKRLSGLRHLRSIFLSPTSLTDEGLLDLQTFPELEKLCLTGEFISDGGMRFLRDSTHIKMLELEQTAVTGTFLGTPNAFTHLETLNLSHTNVSDAGMKYIKRLSSVVVLDLSNTLVTDDGLVGVEGMTSLEALYLRHTKVSDRGVEHICKLKRLEILDLEGTLITGSALRPTALSGWSTGCRLR